MLGIKIHSRKNFTLFLKGISFLLLFTWPFKGYMQLDSLQKELKNCKNDTAKVDLLNEVAYYTLFVDAEKGKKIALQALDLSTKINYEHGIMRSYGQLGNSFQTLKKYDEAIEAYLNGLRLAQTQNNKIAISTYNHNIGLLYLLLNQYSKAEIYFFETLKADLQIGDSTSIPITYNSIATLYDRLNEPKKSKKYYLEALKYLNNSNLTIEHMSIYANLGKIYNNEREFKKAKEYYLFAIDICLKNEAFQNAAKYYFKLAQMDVELKNYDEAILNYNKSIGYISDFKSTIFIEFDLKFLYQGLAETYLILKDYKNAAFTYSEYIKILSAENQQNDSIADLSTNKAFAEMATKYETEKTNAALKESKYQTQIEKEENAKKTVIIYAVAFGIFLLIILLFFVFRSYRISKALARKINGQKEQIEIQRDEIIHINKEITASIEYAKSIQDSILPDTKIIEAGFSEQFILWLPRDIVSGDFYWYHETETAIFIAAADCTGHGVPGAFVSVSCVNILNQVVIDQEIDDPSKILSKVHQHVCDIFRKKNAELQSNDGMDIALCKINKKSKKIEFSGAMNPLIRVRNGECFEVKGDRNAIGGRTPYNHEFRINSIDTILGDQFYIYSDGFKDQFGGPEGKKYLNKRFLRFLENLSGKPLKDQKKLLDKELKDWCGAYARIDDVLVIGFKL